MMPIIGHVQIAAVPLRHEPGTGELDDIRVLRELDTLGYAGFVGCEYRPAGDTVAGLGWRERVCLTPDTHSNTETTMTKRIIFTGGTGKAGRHAVPHLLAKGYSILNVDLKPLDLPGVNTLIADLTDSGQAFNALTTHFGFDGYDDGAPPKAPDAVVHFAAIPRVMIEPDNKTFAANVTSTYNVIEAAMKLGVRKVIVASSETTYGVCFAEGDKDYHSLPAGRRLRQRPDGQLRPVQGGERKDGARLCHALRRRHLRAAHRQRDRAA